MKDTQSRLLRNSKLSPLDSMRLFVAFAYCAGPRPFGELTCNDFVRRRLMHSFVVIPHDLQAVLVHVLLDRFL